MTREGQRKRPGRRRPTSIEDIGDALPPNVVALPRRLRHFATWAELIASYDAKPSAPCVVLPFVAPRAAAATRPAAERRMSKP